MSTMVNAGPPASPGPTARRFRPLPPPSQPADSPSLHADATTAARPVAAGDSPFARLTATASFRVPVAGGTDEAGSRDGWHDPDPDAGRALGAGRTPVDRALRRWSEGKSRSNTMSRFRMVVRVLTGDDGTAVDLDALRAYPWHQLTVETVQDFHRETQRRYTNQATRNDFMVVVRAVVDECYRVKLISARRREQLLDELYTVAPGRSSRRHRITEDEFAKLVDACLDTGSDFARARNSAIVVLFRTTGLRVGELVALNLADWDRRDDTLILRQTKNGDPHVLFLHPATKALLLEWLAVRGEAGGRLFHGVRGPIHVAMTPASVRYMLSSRCKAAGIEAFGTHDFRRTFATEMLRRYDAALVSKLLNHRKLASTLTYDMSTDDEMRNAVASVNLTARRVGGAA